MEKGKEKVDKERREKGDRRKRRHKGRCEGRIYREIEREKETETPSVRNLMYHGGHGLQSQRAIHLYSFKSEAV
jgi:hypothetical protein